MRVFALELNNDLKGLEELILRVTSNVPSRTAVRDYACRQYEESVMARRYMRLYQQILTSQNQAALG